MQSAVSPVFVGRRRELEHLAADVTRAAGGEPAFALVGGEAGVGKTRLVDEAARIARAAGVRVLAGRCVELGPAGLPLAPLVDALRSLSRSATPEQLDGWLGPARGLLAQLLPSLDPASEPGDWGTSRAAQLPELVLGVVERIAQSQPLLFVVEDLHWADQSTLELVAHLVRGLRGVPVLVLATYRSDEIHRRHPLRPLLSGWERLRTVRRIGLERFDRDEVAAQVAAILDRPADARVVDLVLDRSEGNAFLVEEVVGLIRDGGDPQDLSPSLRDLLMVRVDARSAPARRVLRAVAVGGREVPERLLAVVVGMEQPELMDALRELVENHLLLVDDAGLGYAFRHALARDAIYGEMLPGERVAWHAAYGRALAAAPDLAAEPGAVPSALAHHWFSALDLPAALPALLAAATAAQAYAPAEALRHLERVLEIWVRVPGAAELTGTDPVEVVRTAADVGLRAGSVDRVLSLLDGALADPDPSVPVDRRALLLERRARALRDLGRETESLAVLRSALDLLPVEPVTPALAIVRTSLANSLLRMSDLPAAEATAGQAVTAAVAAGSHVEEAEARITLGTARGYLGNTDGALADIRVGLALAERIDATDTRLRGHVNHSDLLEMLGRHEEAVDAARAGLELAQRVGSGRTLGAYLTGNMVEPLLRLGRWDEAERAAVESLRGEPEGVFAATLLDVRAQLAVLAGRHQDGEQLAKEARRVLGPSRDIQFQQSLAFTGAEVLRLRGDLDGAATVVSEALAVEPASWFGRYSWPLVWLGTRIAVDRVVLARDRRALDPSDGLAELDAVVALLPIRSPPARGYAAAVAAERLRLGGTGAVDGWESAVASWRVAGEPYLLGYCLLRLAEAHCAVNARVAATAAAGEAARLSAALGAVPLAAEVAALARRARLPSAPDAAAGVASDPAPVDDLAHLHLTERETEVLGLLATGRSNPQIATTLFISPKTVSVHVSNILAKLGATGRVEAAAVYQRLTDGPR